MNPIRFAATATAIALAGLASAAVAGPSTTVATTDTTVLIDQAKALAGGVTANDTAGFPITISKPGNYRLASNLVVPAGVDGILVTVNDVTIDLNGFSITGPASCGGSPGNVICNNNLTNGVRGFGGDVRRLALSNGVIGGFANCLIATRFARISDLDMHDCNSGLFTYEGSRVTRVGVHNSRFAAYVSGSIVEDMSIDFVMVGISVTNSVTTRLNITQADQAIINQNSGGASPSSVRESLLNARLPMYNVSSTGGNLCNGVAC